MTYDKEHVSYITYMIKSMASVRIKNNESKQI